MSPDQIPLGYYTHLNYAFAYIDPATFRVANMDSTVGSLYKNVTGLKAKQPGLKVWLTIGGWSFNDPGPTTTTFSQLIASEFAQLEFFASLISVLAGNNFDGVDIDWYVYFLNFDGCKTC
jgi:chitinase